MAGVSSSNAWRLNNCWSSSNLQPLGIINDNLVIFNSKHIFTYCGA